MSEVTVGLFGVAVFMLLLVLGVPLAFAMGAVGVAGTIIIEAGLVKPLACKEFVSA